MIKLLTGEEIFADCVNVYNEDYTGFTTVGEPRGKVKQVTTDWMDETDYYLLYGVFKRLGLDKYIDMCLDENTLYIRIYEEDEV